MLGLKSRGLEEKFLLLDIAPKGVSAVFLVADAERNLTPRKIWGKYSVNKLLRDPFSRLAKAQLIVSADPAFATTLSLPVGFKRDGTQPLELPELETLLSQTLSRLFVDCRKEAARRLGKNELDKIGRASCRERV